MIGLVLLSALAQEPDPAALARAGAKSALRLRDGAASWTVTHETPTGARFLVSVLQDRTRRRLALSAEVAGEKIPLSRIVERDGLWYVVDGPQAGKYRPYEAPLSLSTAYFYLARSNVLVMADREGLEGWKHEETLAGVAAYRAPVPEAVRRSLERMLDRPEARAARARIADLLEHGLLLRLEVATGIVVETGNSERRLAVGEIRLLDKVDEAEFAVAGRSWTDVSSDPTRGDPSEWVMIGHNAHFRPGGPKGELDVRLLHAKSGELRRVPFRGGNALPGCFLRDRRKAVVSGLTEDGALGLFEVDLGTGENRRLGGKLLESGYALGPAASPDGKSLAVMHKAGTEGLLEFRVALIDLASGEGRHLGEPLDGAFLSWLPDGKGLVLLRREAGAGTVTRMDLDGRLAPIVKGDSPVVLEEARAILFQEGDLWRTCDLAGKNAKLLGDGLKGHGFPSPAPDGKRLLMMRFRPNQAPEPVVVSLSGQEIQPATKLPGLWGFPAWR